MHMHLFLCLLHVISGDAQYLKSIYKLSKICLYFRLKVGLNAREQRNREFTVNGS